MLYLLLLLLLATAEGRSTGESVELGDEDALNILLEQINATRIGNFIERMSENPRNTQSNWMGDKEEDLKQLFRDAGLRVATKRYKVLQCFPKGDNPSVTEVLDESGNVLDTFREDGDMENGVLPAYNAWSKSGTVEGEPVYVNYGRKADFERLLARGINLTETIGIARYGKIYRGDKAKFAKEYGLNGLIIYMDAQDFAPDGVEVMPDGPGLPVDGVQRGTLKAGLGDPSTYLYPSTQYAYHAPAEEYEKVLPGITVMPTSFKNALPIIGSLAGVAVDGADWQGAGNASFPQYYYGPGFKENSPRRKLRINVELEYKLVEIEDIFGILKGKQEPDRWVMMGNHRDTWVHGAVDATTGLATLNEMAQGLKKLSDNGWKPRRTIVLASWGAEEQGIIGSTEFVEDYLTLLQEKLVTYINVDVASSGQQTFAPKSTPNLRLLIEEAAGRASAPLDTQFTTLLEQWTDSSNKRINELGSGSDFAAFINMAGVSCIDLTMHGDPKYFTYHTEYDNFRWLSKFADPGMKSTKAVSEVAAVILFELASQTLLPLNSVTYGAYLTEKIGQSSLEKDLADQGIDGSILTKAIERFSENAQAFEERKDAFLKQKRTAVEIRELNDKMLLLERSFIFPHGLPGRPQNMNVLFAPSSLNSYSGSVFPGLFDSITLAKEEEDPALQETRWNQVKRELTIAAWVTKAAARAMSNSVFPS